MHVRLRILEAKRQRGIGVVIRQVLEISDDVRQNSLVRAVNQAEYAIGIIIGAGGVLRVATASAVPCPKSIHIHCSAAVVLRPPIFSPAVTPSPANKG